ncbi:unnamed protein product, partial [marine sediment metagenome]
ELVLDDVLKDNSDFAIVKIPYNYGVKGIIDVYNKTLREDIKYSQRLNQKIAQNLVDKGYYLRKR